MNFEGKLVGTNLKVAIVVVDLMILLPIVY